MFILAGTNERAARVAGTFRAALVGYGLVEADGVNLADGNVAGVGDRIVARRNDRNLTTTKGSFVVNRAVYQVTKRHRRGDLTVAVVDPTSGVADPADHIRLPADYVAESVQLEYAGTTHAAQGATRYASQSLISESDTANSIYVSLTRGTHANVAHVDSISDPDDGHHHEQTRDPVAVLAAILEAEDNPEDLSALEAFSQAVDDAASLATLFPIWQDLESHHAAARWRGYLADTKGERMANWVTSSPAWPTLAARLAELETEGHNPEQLLAAAIAQRDFTGVVDAAATIHSRLEHVGAAGAEGPAGGMWMPFSARDITATRFAPALRQVGGADGPAHRRTRGADRNRDAGMGVGARPHGRQHREPHVVDRAGRDDRLLPRSVPCHRPRPHRLPPDPSSERSPPMVGSRPSSAHHHQTPQPRPPGQRRPAGSLDRLRRPGAEDPARASPPGGSNQDGKRSPGPAGRHPGPPRQPPWQRTSPEPAVPAGRPPRNRSQPGRPGPHRSRSSPPHLPAVGTDHRRSPPHRRGSPN